ncbi:MAG: cbb3-type cytochrome c oxidase subunit 3 [Spirochaetes bacterium]|nr:cbb3-type cytochrome c oxidase subunit 3 [Spirochaetota bacterium]
MTAKVLSDIGNVSIYPIASLVLFFAVFVTMLVLVFRGSKSKYAKIAQLPLEDGSTEGNPPLRK